MSPRKRGLVAHRFSGGPPLQRWGTRIDERREPPACAGCHLPAPRTARQAGCCVSSGGNGVVGRTKPLLKEQWHRRLASGRTFSRLFYFLLSCSMAALRPAGGLVLWLGLAGQARVSAQGEQLPRADSRTPHVHRITLYDHDGVVIDPTDPLAGPYSTRMTCGKCHDYAAISRGWHFNAPLGRVPAGRPGEPWILVDQDGTALPLSSRAWPGALAPEQVGLTDWQFVREFGRHLPGGGFGEPDGDRVARSPQRDRWRISGRLEIDCLFCHSADRQHDPAEAARQIEQENFRWVPTAARGLAVVRGAAREQPDDWDPLMPPDPNYPEQAGPRLVWDKSRFDADDRVFFNVTRRPPNERCYFCHSFREVGPQARQRWHTSRDVHVAAKLMCVDCHRNSIDHMMTRGYSGEADERGVPEVARYSCEGCHLGVEGAYDPELARGGHHGAPHPQHRGLPPLHFERLTCTACHAGPWPRTFARRFQTALAHGLGLARRDRTDELLPILVGPVFLRQHDGRIAPHRLLWQVRADGAGFGSEQHPLSQPYAWPIAHDVRPAAQALGAGGCRDCHARNAPIYFGHITTRDLLPTAPPARLMHELRGDSGALAAAWALGFAFRPAFKWFGLGSAAAVFLVLLRGLLWWQPGAGVAGLPVGRSDAKRARTAHRIPGLLLGVGLVGLAGGAVTGFGAKWVLGELRGWLLLVHMLAAPLFVIGLTGVAIAWSVGYHFGLRPSQAATRARLIQGALFQMAILLGLATMSSMLVAMLPVFGYTGQEALTRIHEISALALMITLAALAWASWAVRGARR